MHIIMRAADTDEGLMNAVVVYGRHGRREYVVSPDGAGMQALYRYIANTNHERTTEVRYGHTVVHYTDGGDSHVKS